MESLNTYVELPYKGADNHDSDFISAFGYMDIQTTEINKYLIARQFRDNCSDQCSCNPNYYNPAFLMRTGEFDEKLSSESSILSDSLKLFSDLDAVNAEVEKILKSKTNKNNDLLIYQLIKEQPTYQYATFTLVKILPQTTTAIAYA